MEGSDVLEDECDNVGEGVDVSWCFCCIFIIGIGEGEFSFFKPVADRAVEDKGKGKLNRTAVCLSEVVDDEDKGEDLND